MQICKSKHLFHFSIEVVHIEVTQPDLYLLEVTRIYFFHNLEHFFDLNLLTLFIIFVLAANFTTSLTAITIDGCRFSVIGLGITDLRTAQVKRIRRTFRYRRNRY